MDLPALRARLNTLVVLTFADGEEVEAILLGVDADEHEDITYEVRRIIRPAGSPALGSAVGATVVAPIADLTRWRAS